LISHPTLNYGQQHNYPLIALFIYLLGLSTVATVHKHRSHLEKQATVSRISVIKR